MSVLSDFEEAKEQKIKLMQWIIDQLDMEFSSPDDVQDNQDEYWMLISISNAIIITPPKPYKVTFEGTETIEEMYDIFYGREDWRETIFGEAS